MLSLREGPMARILLVDDDPTTLDMVNRALAGDGHQVIVCQEGQDALDRLLAAPATFDLLVSDLQMPGLDGVGLAQRAVAASPRLRIVLMSGFIGGVDRAHAIKGAAVRFFSKPFTLEEIRAEVRAALA
jgi:two-component system cell cycle response regulator CpdR